MQNLLIKEGLLYVAVVFVGYGAAVIGTDFWKATIALVIGAALVGVRGYLKKLNINC